MKLKSVSLLWTVVLAMLIASCGVAPPEEVADDPDGEDNGDEPAAEEDPDQPVQLSFWTNLTVPAQADVIQRHVDECLDEPELSNISVDFETVGFDVMYPRLLTALEEGNPPNIMNTTENAVAFTQARGGLVPVDDVLDELGRDDFIESFLNAVVRDDQAWGVPDWALHQAVYYREDLFEEAGIDIPRSWDELLDAAAALTDGQTFGFAVPMSSSVSTAQHTLFQVLYSDGIYVFDPETGEYVFDRDLDRATAALEFMLELYEAASPPASIEWGVPDYRTAFVEGQVAMTNEWGAVVLQAVEENPEMLDNMGVFAFPSPEADREPAATLAGGYYYIIGDTTPAEAAASKTLVTCMYDPVRVAERANSRPIFASPATESAYETDVYQDNEYVQMFNEELELLREGPMASWFRYGLEAGLNPLAGQIEATEFIPDNIQAAALGEISAREAIENIDAELQRLIEALD